MKKRTREQIRRHENWEKKKQTLQSKGVEIRMTKECDWDRFVKNNPNISETDTRMPRIFKTDTEETLLEAIRNDHVFGFAVCSVKTNSNDVEKLVKVSDLLYNILYQSKTC